MSHDFAHRRSGGNADDRNPTGGTDLHLHTVCHWLRQ
jgi:hypothetical protein